MPREFGRAKPDEAPQLIAADDGYRMGWAGLGPVERETPVSRERQPQHPDEVNGEQYVES